jgi:hypothetical protein
MEDTPVFQIRGMQDELVVYEDKLTITPKGFIGLMNKSFKGTKTIYFNTITGLEMRSCSNPLMGGYLQFEVNGVRGSEGVSDENTFLYVKTSDNEMVEKIKLFVEGKMTASKAQPQSAPSTADEIAKLADLKAKGVISEDDFNKAKNKLLGIVP